MSELFGQCVVIVVMNSQNKVLICKMTRADNAWQFPQGTIDSMETPQKAMYRELQEETNITSIELVRQMEGRTKYLFPRGVKSVHNDNWIGKEYNWFLVKFIGDESEIKFDTKPDEIEFSDCKWVDPKDVVEHIVDFKKDAYKQAMKEFFDV